MYFLNLTVALVQVIDVLSKMAGLWIDTNKTVLYSQATHITFICPMRKGIADIL
jgi:predicted ATP-grasp superfamily ATP-dependent carboligase